MPPQSPRGKVHRLPPILRIDGPDPMPRCSKAPRGLFVLPQVTSIFTGTSISPGPLLRQRPTRYAIRAGRNLPDKEFRSVHRGVSAATYPTLFPEGPDFLFTRPVFICSVMARISVMPSAVKCDFRSISKRIRRNLMKSTRFLERNSCFSKNGMIRSLRCSTLRTR